MGRPKTLSDEERKKRDADRKTAWRKANQDRQASYAKAWYEANKQRAKDAATAWGKANPEKTKASRDEYWNNNREKCRQMGRNWRAANKGAVNAYAAKYRACKLQATPPWADFVAIAAFYLKAAQEKLHVDHIIPLRGKLVSGLHVLSNLQMLTKSQNSRKSNTFEGA